MKSKELEGYKWADLGRSTSSSVYFSLKQLISLHAETPAVIAGVSLKGERPETAQMSRVNNTLGSAMEPWTNWHLDSRQDVVFQNPFQNLHLFFLIRLDTVWLI